MKLEQLINKLKETKELPGWNAQSEMAVPMRKNYTYDEVKDVARHASVLVLFYEKNNEIVFPLNLRHHYEGVHSNQIGLPGGSKDYEAETKIETALRETEEELGVDKNKVRIIRPISPIFVPPSQFLVSPFIGYLEEEPIIIKDNIEVKEVIEISLKDLMDKSNVGMQKMEFYNYPIEVPAFLFGKHVVWGATAMILSEVVALVEN